MIEFKQLTKSDCTSKLCDDLSQCAKSERNDGTVDQEKLKNWLLREDQFITKYAIYNDTETKPNHIAVILFVPAANLIETFCVREDFRGKMHSSGMTYAAVILKEFLKIVGNKPVWAYATLSAVKFYLRNGFVSEIGDADNPIWNEIKRGHTSKDLKKRYRIFKNTVVVWFGSDEMPPLAAHKLQCDMSTFMHTNKNNDDDDDKVSNSDEDEPPKKRSNVSNKNE